MDFWQHIFSGSDFMPRYQCGDWSPGLIALHIISDVVIWLSYLWIPLIMFVAFRAQKRRLVIPPAALYLLLLYVTFIVACGFTHFFDAMMFWNPVYRLNGLMRGLTAIVSFLTAASLSRLIPVAITAPMALNAQKTLLKQQQAWLRDILDSATGGVLHMCADKSELPAPMDAAGDPVSITDAKSLRVVRRAITALTESAGFDAERADGLLTATHEAAMNALRHAGGGTLRTFRTGDRVQVWIEDNGSGIPLDKLPIATLKQGYSTMGTAGQGWFLVLSFADAVYLSTGASGTTVVLEVGRVAPTVTIPLSEWVGGDIPAPAPRSLDTVAA